MPDFAKPMSLYVVEAVDHVRGKHDAAVSLVEFGDFECATCHQAYPAVKALLDQYKEQLRFSFRHFPLNDLRPLAERAAAASEAAAAQDRFWAYHDHLFTHAPARDEQVFVEYAQQLGLDVERFSRDMRSRKRIGRIADQAALARSIGVRSTPAFFVNGELVDASFGLEGLRAAIRRVA